MSTGLSMATITPVIAFLTVPVAFGAAVIGYAASPGSRVIGYAVIISCIVAVAIWALLRSQKSWRQRLQPTNELIAGVMVGMLGFAFTIGGLAAGALVWVVIGLIVLAGALLIARTSFRPRQP